MKQNGREVKFEDIKPFTGGDYCDKQEKVNWYNIVIGSLIFLMGLYFVFGTEMKQGFEWLKPIIFLVMCVAATKKVIE